MTPQLSLVHDHRDPVEDESLAHRVKRLQDETREVTDAHIAQLVAAILRVAELGEEIAGGGEAYPPAVRDIARRLSQEGPVAARGLGGALRAANVSRPG